MPLGSWLRRFAECREPHPPPEGVARTPRLRRGVGTGRGGTAPATARADGDDDAGRPGGIGGIVGLRGFVETPDSPIDFAAPWRGVRSDRSVSASRPWARGLESEVRMADMISAFPRQRDKAGWNRIGMEFRIRQMIGCFISRPLARPPEKG